MSKQAANPFSASVERKTVDESLIFSQPKKSRKPMGRQTNRIMRDDDVKSSVIFSAEEHMQIKLHLVQNRIISMQEFIHAAVIEKLARS